MFAIPHREINFTQERDDDSMKQRLQGMVLGVVIGAMCTSGLVFAKQVDETIRAAYDNIKIIINGKECVPKDVNGTIVEPFVYNGTTYVPIRAISQAFDKNVEWDGDNRSVIISDKTEVSQDKLPAIEVKGNGVILSSGITINDAKEQIAEFTAKQSGYKGDIQAIAEALTVKDITVKEGHNNNRILLFAIGSDNNVSGVAVFKDREIVDILSGMPVKAIYLADLNGDGKYEVCTNSFVGSGIVDLRIGVLDVENAKQYVLSKRMEYDLLLEIDEETKDLVVYKPFGEEDILLGALAIKDDGLIISEK